MSNAKLKNTIDLRKANSKIAQEKPFETNPAIIEQNNQVLFYLDKLLVEQEYLVVKAKLTREKTVSGGSE